MFIANKKKGIGMAEQIEANAHLFTEKQLKICKGLLEERQAHVFSHWPKLGSNDSEKIKLVEQIESCDDGYPGGLRKYIENARKLLEESREGKNAFDGWEPAVPKGERVEYASETHREYERVGVREAKRTAFVLVAGGLGERLGYKGIKVRLPVERATGESYLGLYVKSILALQDCESVGGGISDNAAGGADAIMKKIDIPLAIMTSEDTHALTLELLETNDYFGAKKSQIHLMKQEKVPCLSDDDAHLALNDDDKYVLQTKPHGHGDVHSLLHQSGLLAKWKDIGIEWVTFFQDTNSLVFRVIPGALGVSKKNDFEFNSLCVPRKAKEAVGGIAQLTHKDGSRMTINVEYNQLDPLLRATTSPEGDVNDETGFSPYPGNINQLIIKLEPYEKQLAKTGGAIDEFVNPKYKDDTKTTFKSPTRLECMMQDYPKSLSKSASIGFTVFDNWVGYSPVKNSPEDGKRKFDDKQPTHTATSGEFEFYNCQAKILRLAGANVPEPKLSVQKYNDMQFPIGPKCVLSPTFGCTFDEIKQKIGHNVSMTENSVLILEGNVHLENVKIDGSVHIKALNGAKIALKDCEIKNKGWSWNAVANAAEETARLCGFVVVKLETASLTRDYDCITTVLDTLM